MGSPGRDRLRELLDAVLDEDHRNLDEMAGGAHASPYHFSRLLARDTGEPPVAMRRRVMLERAAWQLRRGQTVTEAAWVAGYDSAEGFSRAFSRAFGHPPSTTVSSHWLPAPNGIHFHPPMSLWVQAEGRPMDPLTEQLIEHDLDDTSHLLDRVADLDDAAFRAERYPGATVLAWDGPEPSIQTVLEHHIWTKEIWLASIEGLDLPERDNRADPAALRERHQRTAPRWLATVRGIHHRGGWDDRLIDALCEPPESFALSSVIAHVLTYAGYRRQQLRLMLRDAGCEVDHGDPIMWLRSRRGEKPGDDHGLEIR